MIDFDVLILGSGLAGQSLALRLADKQRVAIITKKALEDSASGWAQGGIAAVLDSTDTIEAHIQDTFTAGAGLCDPATTRLVVEHGRQAIEWLISQGVHFTRDTNSDIGYHLTREGGHSHRRVIHVDDATGAAVQETLTDKVRRHPNIQTFEHHIAIDLITGSKLGLADDACLGAYVFDIAANHVKTFRAPQTVLATGGTGKVYLYTTNPDTATGDGVAMAWRAGCRVADMEFVQFHPTCL
ncbi:MAG: FAD-binding protein, partial [Sterolibacterium sp.]|nr:FAD-binding protein [Sterolibacterium sp.]